MQSDNTQMINFLQSVVDKEKMVLGYGKEFFKQIYEAFYDIASGVEWQAEKHGLGGMSKEQALYFHTRFVNQWYAKTKYIFSLEVAKNPIAMIIAIVFFALIRVHGQENAERLLKKVFPSLIIKASSHYITNAYLKAVIIQPTLQKIFTSLAMKEIVRKVVTGVTSAGTLIYFSEQGMESRAAIALIKLQMSHPNLCDNLVINNVDMFWFLLSDKFTPLLNGLS